MSTGTVLPQEDRATVKATEPALIIIIRTGGAWGLGGAPQTHTPRKEYDGLGHILTIMSYNPASNSPRAVR